MSPTVKYILIGGAVAGGVLLVAKAMTPTPQPVNPIAQVITGLKGLFGGASSGTTPPPSSVARTMPLGTGTTPYGPGSGDDGDAAISDGLGIQKTKGRGPTPTAYTTTAQRAQVGAIPASHFGLYPGRN